MKAYCCPQLEAHINIYCGIHTRDECPDKLIIEVGECRFGLSIKDSGGSYILITYCPFCGNRVDLTEKQRADAEYASVDR